MTTASLPPPLPEDSLTGLRTRRGVPDDVDDVTAMHARCSPDSLEARFHVPLPRVGARIVRQLLTPTAGWSVVAELDDQVVGLACVGPVSGIDLEVGLLLEDAYQSRGIGSRMLHEIAVDAAGRGYRRLQCLTQPDNDRVPATVRRAGLLARMGMSDGLLLVEMPLARVAGGLAEPA